MREVHFNIVGMKRVPADSIPEAYELFDELMSTCKAHFDTWEYDIKSVEYPEDEDRYTAQQMADFNANHPCRDGLD